MNALARVRPGLLFARHFLANPRHVGSVIPSSRRLIQRLLAGIDWSRVQIAVEYGPGTGVVTRALLARLGPEARLHAFEINPEFAAYLRREIADPRLVVVEASAELVAQRLPGPADLVVSSLPFTVMPRDVSARILAATATALAPGAPLVGYQYSKAWLRALRRVFPRVDVDFEPRNWPPAFVFRARLMAQSSGSPASRN